MNDKDYMRQAIELARINVAQGGGPFGAVIVKDGEVIARSGNSVTRDNDPTAHAEINCIRDACKKLESFELKGCVVYSSCEPCPMCLGAIYWAHIDRLYYGCNKSDAADAGFDDSFIYKELELDSSERRLKTEELLPDEAKAAFEAWKSNESKIEY